MARWRLTFFLTAAGGVFLIFGAAWIPRQVEIKIAPPLGEENKLFSLVTAVFSPKEESLPPGVNSFSGKPLAHPPSAVRAIYLTSWTVGNENHLRRLIESVENDPRLNALVVDIKDYTGYLAYAADLEVTRASGAEREIKVADIGALIDLAHRKNIYLIGRISVFQDQVLATYRPQWAVAVSSGGLWRDRKGLAWLDPGAQQVWEYNLAIAKDALARGFDEINFDYIRFPADGDLTGVHYPFSAGREKRQVIQEFFRYLRENLADAKISVDVFGLTTVATDDLGIGQVIEDAYRYFDYVAPMVYPSHYAAGFIGYHNPAAYPYEVVKYSLEGAVAKRQSLVTASDTGQVTTSSYPSAAVGDAPVAKLRPWLQAFDLGAIYNKPMIEAQIKAVEEEFESYPSAGAGWMLWDPANEYRGYLE